ncbi:MAG: hypothetical protein WC602_02180 [archaeon]
MASQAVPKRRSSPQYPGSSPQTYPVQGIGSDIRALNSAILIISQKIEHLVRNEKILSRNIIVLNKRLKDLEGAQSGGNPSEKSAQLEQSLSAFSEKLEKQANQLSDLASQFSSLESKFALKPELQEIKYIVQAINPLEFVTAKQVEEMIDKKLGQNSRQEFQAEEKK